MEPTLKKRWTNHAAADLSGQIRGFVSGYRRVFQIPGEFEAVILLQHI